MKLTSFACTIEVSKDENGYSNNCYVDITDKGVSISNAYVVQPKEQAKLVTELIHDFIATSIAFNDRIDKFNRDNHLEQYSLKSILEAEVETAYETDVDANTSSDTNATEVRHE